MRENVAAGLWVALLIAAGFAESVRQEKCLMRGGANCQNGFLKEMVWAQRGRQVPKEHVGIAAHLKNSRQW